MQRERRAYPRVAPGLGRDPDVRRLTAAAAGPAAPLRAADEGRVGMAVCVRVLVLEVVAPGVGDAQEHLISGLPQIGVAAGNQAVVVDQDDRRPRPEGALR